MNELKLVCEQLNLGDELRSYDLQQGGSLHRLWHVVTERGQYSVKKINYDHLNLLGDRLLPIAESQYYAATSWNIQKVAGLDWLVHDWIEGEVLSPMQISLKQAEQLGVLTRQALQINPHPEAQKPNWHRFDYQLWEKIIREGEVAEKRWARMYSEALPMLIHWGEMINQTQHIFTENLVMSHRDISHSNVVWTPKGEPVLIDWEFAGLIHPDVECYITLRNFQLLDPAKRQAFEAGLGRTLSLINEDCEIGYLGYCLDWLLFNMQRSLKIPHSSGVADQQLVDYLSVIEESAEIL